MSSDPTDQDNRTDTRDPLSAGPADGHPSQGDPDPQASEDAAAQTESADRPRQRRILIGSQRDPAAYRARRTRDWAPLPEVEESKAAVGRAAESVEAPAADAASVAEPPLPAARVGEAAPEEAIQPQPSAPQREVERLDHRDAAAEPDTAPQPGPAGRFPLPNLREKLSPDLEQEFDEAIGGESVDELLSGDSSVGRTTLEEESRHTGRVVAVQRDDVFVELGSREQGCVSLKQFDQPPEVGANLEVIVQRLNPEDGLYELALPGAAVEVDDWGDVKEGMLVEARVTGHNTGGLECEVNHLRGFIPVSQIALYRVDDLAQFVDEKFTCLITEANPQRRNLVLSRRAVLERKKEEARQKLLESLQPGQIHQGVVRKLVDFGAFVEIGGPDEGGQDGGGLDGLLHISQLGWGRIQHPSEVLAEGQTIKVKIESIDHETGKMSLAYRELLENPWDSAERKFPVNTEVEGTVTKLAEYGAFVELEPGVEGLVHISELSHKRVWRTSDVVQQGEKVRVMVLSVDPAAQRIGLSIRQTIPEPEPKQQEPGEPAPPPANKPKRKGPPKPLTGGLGKSSGGDKFGLKW